MIMVAAMLVGCGKTKPVSATSSTPVETVTSEPEKIETEITLTPTTTPTAEPTVSTPTPTPTTSVSTPSTEFIFDGNFDFPEEDEKALKELYDGNFTKELTYLEEYKCEDYKYTLNNGEALAAEYEALYMDFANWLGSWEM